MSFDAVLDSQKELFKLARKLCDSQYPKESPGQLFHYTDLQGFVGIVTSRSLWASDMLSLEDVSEATYANQIFNDVLGRSFPSIDHEHRDDFLRMLREGNFRMYTPFVTCFCEDGDLLSQWRGYGGGGEGFAMAFKLSWLSSLRHSGFLLRKVLYRRDEQEDLISKYLQGALELLACRGFKGEDVGEFWQTAAVPAADLVVAIKDSVFANEREWRLVNAEIQLGEEFKYRPTGRRIVPYMTIPIKNEAVAGVVRGAHFAGQDIRGIEHMLLYNEFTEASNRVQDSKVPIRR